MTQRMSGLEKLQRAIKLCPGPGRQEPPSVSNEELERVRSMVKGFPSLVSWVEESYLDVGTIPPDCDEEISEEDVLCGFWHEVQELSIHRDFNPLTTSQQLDVVRSLVKRQ